MKTADPQDSIFQRIAGLEHKLSALLLRLIQAGLERLALLAVCGAYSILFALAPPQLAEVSTGIGPEEPLWTWAAAMLPTIAAASGHLILLAHVTRLRGADVILASVPTLLIAAMCARWSPAGLWFAIPLAAATVGANFYLLPRVAGPSRTRTAIAIFAMAAAFVAAVISCLLWPVAFPVLLGPLVVLTGGVSLIGLILAIALLRPLLAGLYFLICLVGSSLGPGSQPIALIPPTAAPQPERTDLRSSLQQWLQSRPDLDDYRRTRRPYPVIIASAEGGGIYAAAHAYIALAAMQEICPSFPDHLFATVGVSGGSIGTLLYSAERAANARQGRLQPCNSAPVTVDAAPLTRDLLSPPLANLLFVQVADFLIPAPSIFPDSGQVITEAIGDMVPNNALLRAPLRAGWASTGSRPLTIFVATDIHSGNRFILSPRGSGTDAETFPAGNIESLNDIPANSAAFISARFPWLTPTARLQVSENSYRILADGGYFENSGADTATDLVEQIREVGEDGERCAEDAEAGMNPDPAACQCPITVKSSFSANVDWEGCGIPIFLAYMPIMEWSDGLPGYVYEDSPAPPQSYFLDPLSTMLRVRTTRGHLAINRARTAFIFAHDEHSDDPEMAQGSSVDIGFFPHMLPISEMALPLGWKLSLARAQSILAVSAPAIGCAEAPAGESTIAHARSSNACAMQMLAWLFDPTADPSSHGAPYGG